MGRILVVGTMALLLLAAACEFTRAFSSSACRYSAGCNECGTRTDLGQRLYSTVAAVPVSCAVLREAASVGLSRRRAGVELRLPNPCPRKHDRSCGDAYECCSRFLLISG